MLKFGVEIELVSNVEVKDYGNNIAEYHGGRFGHNKLLPSWKIECDSSIYDENEFDENICAEFITKIFHRRELKSILDQFSTFFKKGTFKFSNTLVFNKSCGCHIHFSDDDKKLKTLMTYTHLKKIRNNVMRRIETELPQIYKSYKKQYFRSYATKPTSEMIVKHEEYCEFNFIDFPGKGIEWRGFNLRGVTKWWELYKMFEIALDEIIKMYNYYKKSKLQERFETEFDFTRFSKYIAPAIKRKKVRVFDSTMLEKDKGGWINV